MKGLAILVLDDEQTLADELCEYLVNLGHRCTASYRPAEAFAVLRNTDIEILLLDLKLPEMNGIEVLRSVRRDYPDVEVIVMSGHGDIESVTEAFRIGAFDFLHKSFRPADVRIALERTGTYRALQRRYHDLKQRHERMAGELKRTVGAEFIGTSDAARQVLMLVERAAENPDTTVLIEGESGTGKELVAHMIHFQSSRADGPLVPVNCAAVNDELFDSLFFGHVKGAYTGAVANRAGYLQRADGGTLFLDEVAELPISMQAKLLRVLEYGTFLPVGSDKERTVDVRVVAATNRELTSAVEKGEFRMDLYFRLQTVEIIVPPLRDRPEDIEPLVHYFLDEFAEKMGRRRPGVDDKLLRDLQSYSFPGNIRELRNLVERAMIYGFEQGFLKVARGSTPAALSAGADSPPGPSQPEPARVGPGTDARSLPTLDLVELEKHAITEALRRSGGNRTRAARVLGISRQGLTRRIEKYDIRDVD